MTDEDAKVIGHQTDDSGETYGVMGEVDSPEGYGLYTPDDARIAGIIASDGDWIVVADTGDDAPNVLQGDSSNSIDTENEGQTISGGKGNTTSDDYGTVSGGEGNTADGARSVVAGGSSNQASGSAAAVVAGSDNQASGSTAAVVAGSENEATSSRAFIGSGVSNEATGSMSVIGGGWLNEASGPRSVVLGGKDNVSSSWYTTIGGGENNTVDGSRATVPGGEHNTADGDHSFAAGYRADTNDNDGTFVWGDDSSHAVEADEDDQVVFQAGGGMTVYTDSDTTNDTGAELPSGSGSWTTLSSASTKTNVNGVDPQTVLAGVESLDVATWEYKSQDDAVHMGPMAEQFHEAFQLGEDERRIANVDADGVALAAIQGLSQQLAERDERIDELAAESERKDQRIDELEHKADRVDTLEETVETLRDELRTIREEVTDSE